MENFIVVGAPKFKFDPGSARWVVIFPHCEGELKVAMSMEDFELFHNDIATAGGCISLAMNKTVKKLSHKRDRRSSSRFSPKA